MAVATRGSHQDWARRLGLVLRDNPDDPRVLSECRRLYRDLPVEDRVVLDLGAHIGIVSRMLVEQGARHVIAVEPDLDSFSVLALNVHRQAVTPLWGAVAGHGSTATIYSKDSSPSCNRITRPRQGGTERVVPAWSLAYLLTRYEPDFVKMDIEGAEYGLLDTLYNLPDHVRAMAMEVHFERGKRRAEGEALMESWRLQGFELVRSSNITPVIWNHNGVWVRS